MSANDEQESAGTAVAKPEDAKGEAVESLKKFLEKHREAIVSAAANRINPDRVLKVALLAATKSPHLSHPKTDRMSLLRSIVSAASLGLEAGSALGEAYLVPYWNKNTGKYDVELIIGYRGLVALARRSGTIAGVDARPVFEGEEFEVYYGTDPKIVHRPRFDIERTKEKLIAAYTVWHLTDETVQFDVMSLAEIEAIRARSKAKDNGPWKTDYIEMAKKTVTRRSVKMVPMSIEMAEAIDDDARREFGDLELGTVTDEATEALEGKGANAKFAAMLLSGPSERQRRLIENEHTPGALGDEDKEELRQLKLDHPEWFGAKS